MKMNPSILIIGVTVIALIGVFGFMWSRESSTPGQYDAFATCLKDKGVTFYGAFWCPHCQSQKALFGKSEKLLPYVECSLPDGKTQTAACRDAGIEGYPTWEFADGERMTGEVPLATLSEKSGCPLP